MRWNTGMGHSERLRLKVDFHRLASHRTMSHFSNGVPISFETQIAGIVYDAGNDENEILLYLLIKLNKQRKTLTFNIDSEPIPLNTLALNDFIGLLDKHHIAWVFSKCWDKLLYLMIVQSKVEICFAFYDDQEGYGVETIEVIDQQRYNQVFSLTDT